jgi:hypothetical protein
MILENMTVEQLDKALEDALQMPARTRSERFQRAISVANVKYWYEKSAGIDPTVPENLQDIFDQCSSDAIEFGV